MVLCSLCTFPPYDKRKPKKEDEMDNLVDVVHPRQLRLGTVIRQKVRIIKLNISVSR